MPAAEVNVEVLGTALHGEAHGMGAPPGELLEQPGAEGANPPQEVRESEKAPEQEGDQEPNEEEMPPVKRSKRQSMLIQQQEQLIERIPTLVTKLEEGFSLTGERYHLASVHKPLASLVISMEEVR